MSKKNHTSVRSEVDRIAKKFGLSPKTVTGAVFKNSRVWDQLNNREKTDAERIERLLAYERGMESKRQSANAKVAS